MSKYNSGASIPISSLSDEELRIAIHEWAEGNNSLESLLWRCYKNGIETQGCHSGLNSYLQIGLKSPKDKLIKILGAIHQLNDSDIFILPNGGNPFSGPDWYKPSICIGSSSPTKKESNRFFDVLSNTIDENDIKQANEDSLILELLNYLYFFNGKGLDENLRLVHNANEKKQYTFSIEGFYDINNFNRLNPIYQKNGFKMILSDKIEDLTFFTLSSNDPQELAEKMRKGREYLQERYWVEYPSPENATSTNLQVRLMRMRFGDTQEGRQKFEEWFENERRIHEKIKERYRREAEIKRENQTSGKNNFRKNLRTSTTPKPEPKEHGNEKGEKNENVEHQIDI